MYLYRSSTAIKDDPRKRLRSAGDGETTERAEGTEVAPVAAQVEFQSRAVFVQQAGAVIAALHFAGVTCAVTSCVYPQDDGKSGRERE